MNIDFDYIDKMVAAGNTNGMLKWYENIYFLTVSAWRQYLKSGLCNRKDASEAKMLCRKEVNNIVKEYEFGIKMADHTAQLFKDTELARAAYRKDRTLENADAMLSAIDGVLKEVNE